MTCHRIFWLCFNSFFFHCNSVDIYRGNIFLSVKFTIITRQKHFVNVSTCICQFVGNVNLISILRLYLLLVSILSRIISLTIHLFLWISNHILLFVSTLWHFVHINPNIILSSIFCLSKVASPSLSLFGSAAAVVFFLKRSCSRLVTKKNSLLFIGSHLFSALETQYLQSKNYMLFLHCSRNCTVHVKNSEQCTFLALRGFFF